MTAMRIHFWRRANYNTGRKLCLWSLGEQGWTQPPCRFFFFSAMLMEQQAGFHSSHAPVSGHSGLEACCSSGDPSPSAACPPPKPTARLWLAPAADPGQDGDLGLCPAGLVRGSVTRFLHCLTPGYPKSGWTVIGQTFESVWV